MKKLITFLFLGLLLLGIGITSFIMFPQNTIKYIVQTKQRSQEIITQSLDLTPIKKLEKKDKKETITSIPEPQMAVKKSFSMVWMIIKDIISFLATLSGLIVSIVTLKQMVRKT